MARSQEQTVPWTIDHIVPDLMFDRIMANPKAMLQVSLDQASEDVLWLGNSQTEYTEVSSENAIRISPACCKPNHL